MTKMRNAGVWEPNVLEHDLMAHIQGLETTKEHYLERVRLIDEDLKILRRAAQILVRTETVGFGVVNPHQGDSQGSVPTGAGSLISGCKTIMEACEMLADANGGLLQLTRAARDIRLVGLSRARVNGSLSATIHGYLKRKQNEWVQEGPGVWRHKTFSDGSVAHADGKHSVEDNSCDSETGGETDLK